MLTQALTSNISVDEFKRTYLGEPIHKRRPLFKITRTIGYSSFDKRKKTEPVDKTHPRQYRSTSEINPTRSSPEKCSETILTKGRTSTRGSIRRTAKHNRSLVQYDF